MLTNEQTLMVLTKGRDLIETLGWNQGAYALNYRDEELDGYADCRLGKASCFCTLGACIAAAAEIGWISDSHIIRDAILVENTVIDSFGIDNVAEWNDAEGRTKAEVLTMFDETIERLTIRERLSQ